MASWSRSESRAALRYNFARGLNVNQCFEETTLALGDVFSHHTTIFRWFRDFQRGNFSLEDAQRAGRPRTSVMKKNIAAVRKMLDEDRRVTYKRIENTLYLNAPAIHSILHDHLQVKKLCCLWVPHTLTEEQMTRRETWCREMLKRFSKDRFRYVNSIVTSDETWVYYYDVPRLKTKFGFLKMKRHPLLSENLDL
ncbi:Mariner Mos1 transposase [Gryllus bimaculatus]|nr:Mariner Mos1 transposase [Gryllus bimaculatus]